VFRIIKSSFLNFGNFISKGCKSLKSRFQNLFKLKNLNLKKKMSINSNYIKDHLEAISEKKQQQFIEIKNNILEIKETNAISNFIQEKIEYIYINEKLDINITLTFSDIICEFRKWCLEKYNKDYEILDNYILKREFANFTNLGPLFEENSWIGIKFKK
jgi:hypothetical protein